MELETAFILREERATSLGVIYFFFLLRFSCQDMCVCVCVCVRVCVRERERKRERKKAQQCRETVSTKARGRDLPGKTRK